MTKAKPRCRKCESAISETASACPECGYDATPGNIAQLGIILAAPVTLAGVFLAGLAVLGGMAGGMTIGETLGVLVALGVVFSPSTVFTAWYLHRRQATAAR